MTSITSDLFFIILKPLNFYLLTFDTDSRSESRALLKESSPPKKLRTNYKYKTCKRERTFFIIWTVDLKCSELHLIPNDINYSAQNHGQIQ